MILELVFFICLGLLAYAWGVYPLLLRYLSTGADHGQVAGGPTSTLAILFAAYNEEESIEARIENLLAITNTDEQGTGPEDHGFTCPAEIWVGIDGSSDRSVELAQAIAAEHDNVYVYAFDQRRGKIAVLKDLVQRCDAQILVFTDANTVFQPDALQRILAHFHDPRVGAVCGRLLFRECTAVHPPPVDPASLRPRSTEGIYWRWETWMKERESALDSCLGANGAIYAVRSGSFWGEIPDNTVVEDFVIGMKVREGGLRMVYEPAAIALEDMPTTDAEWNRRVRIGAGDYQALFLCSKCLSPAYGVFAWSFWSHKVLRWFTPHLIVTVVLIAAGTQFSKVLSPGITFCPASMLVSRLVLALTGLAAVSTLLGYGLYRPESRLARLLSACAHFVVMQAALLAGFCRFCRGDLKGHWTRTPR